MTLRTLSGAAAASVRRLSCRGVTKRPTASSRRSCRAGRGGARVGHVLRDGRRGIAHRQLVARRRSTRSGVACDCLLGLQALVLGVERTLLALRAGRARRTGAARRRTPAPGTRCWPAAATTAARCQTLFMPRPRRSVRSATRITAERERGLARTSASPGLTRPSGLQPVRRLGRERRAAVDLAAALARDEGLHDAVFERVEADHDQACRWVAAVASAAFRPCSSSSSSALT